MSAITEEIIERLLAERREQVDTVHERVACPKCGAPRGARCKAMPRGWRLIASVRVPDVKPHTPRLRAAGIYPRLRL